MEDRDYIQNIQKIVNEKTESLQKRINCIDEKTLSRLKNTSFPKDKEVEILGDNFSIHDVISKLGTYYDDLKIKSNPNFYKHQMINTMKSNLSRSREEAFKMSIYKECKDDITKVFNECDKKLSFITNAFKVLSKEIKNINEKVEVDQIMWKSGIGSDILDSIFNDNELIESTIDKEILHENDKETDVFKNEKKMLYESCANGEISINEREEKLIELKNSSYFETYVDVPTRVEMSNSEKIKAIISLLYEKCSNGEISVDEREKLISKAKCIYITE